MPEEEEKSSYGSPLRKGVATVIVGFSLLGGYYTLTKIFLPREVFDIECIASEKRFKIVDEKFSDADRQEQVRILENQILYYQARELNLIQYQRYEKDPMEKVKLNNDLNQTRGTKEKIEDRLYELKNPR